MRVQFSLLFRRVLGSRFGAPSTPLTHTPLFHFDDAEGDAPKKELRAIETLQPRSISSSVSECTLQSRHGRIPSRRLPSSPLQLRSQYFYGIEVYVSLCFFSLGEEASEKASPVVLFPLVRWRVKKENFCQRGCFDIFEKSFKYREALTAELSLATLRSVSSKICACRIYISTKTEHGGLRNARFRGDAGDVR